MLLLAIVALGVPLASSLSARVNDEVRSQAQGQADLVAATAADLLGTARRRELATLARSAADSVRGRVLVVDRGGVVIADSASPPQLGVSYANRTRPEMVSALSGRSVQTQRPSRTLGEEILATAVPIIRNRAAVGAVRVTQSVAAVHSAIRRVELGLAVIGAIVLALGLVVGAVLAGQIAGPLGRLERVARRVAGGDLSARATIEGSREQRSLGESFNEMTARLQRLLGSQRAFVADASHQLRTPLTGLRLRIEEARAARGAPEAARELDAGLAEVDRLAQIVGELLVLSRAGERELPGERLDLRDVVRRALERWAPAAAERGISLQARAPGAPAPGAPAPGAPASAVPAPGVPAPGAPAPGAPASGASADGGAPEAWCAAADADRALDVLIENALAYSPRGTRVTLACARGGIEVRDEGPGLSESDGEAIFERFHRGSAGRGGPPGSGLGLAIARELAREWGGEVTLRNRERGGAVATLALPAPGRGGDLANA